MNLLQIPSITEDNAMIRQIIFALGLLAANTIFLQLANAQVITDEGLEHQKAIGWLKQNNKFGPDHGIVKDMTSVMDDATKDGFNVNLSFGKNLMKSGKFQSISLWSGQFISFSLTDQQAAKIDLKESSVDTNTAKRQDKRAAKPIFALSELKFNELNQGTIAGSTKLTGTLKCQLLGKLEPGKTYALRQGYRTKVNVLRFHYYEEHPTAEGVAIVFRFNEINEPDADPYVGPMPVFMDICSVAQSGNDLDIELLSNSLGTLFDVTN